MRTPALILILALPALSWADAYKCRDANGRLIFTDGGCPKGTTTERIQGKDVIPADEKTQTEELNNRAQRRLEQLQKEKSDKKRSLDEKIKAEEEAEKNPPGKPAGETKAPAENAGTRPADNGTPAKTEN